MPSSTENFRKLERIIYDKMMSSTFYHLDDISNFKQFQATLNDYISDGKEHVLRLNLDEKDLATIEKIKEISKTIEGSKISIEYICLNYENDYIDNPKEIESLKSFAKECEKRNLPFRINLNNAESTLKNFLVARKTVDEFANKVNNMTIEENGEEVPLSVAEKFMLVYRFTSNRIYRMNKELLNNDMRNWIGVLATDYVICSGFSSLLKCLCDKIFSEDELKCFSQSLETYDFTTKELNSRHANNLIFIKDPKYGIESVFHCDACWDCKTYEDDSTFRFFMLPFNEFLKFKKYDLKFDGNSLVAQANNAPRDEENQTSECERLNSFLLNKYGFKDFEQIKDEYGDIDFIVNLDARKHEIEHRKHMEEAREPVKNRMELLASDQEIGDILKNVCEFVTFPDEIGKKYPILRELKKYLLKFNIDTELDKDLIKRYNEFYLTHRDELIKAGCVEISTNPLLDSLETSCICNVDEGFSYYNRTLYHEDKRNQLYENEKMEFIKSHKKLFLPDDIPQALLKNGLKAIAIFEGKKGKKVKDFVENKLIDRKLYLEENFYGHDKQAKKTEEFSEEDDENFN